MNSHSERNLAPINLQDVVEKIKSLNALEFDKMIIDTSAAVQRCDYYFVKYKAVSASRQSLKLTFPVYAPVANRFIDFEGGDSKHGELAHFPSDKLVSSLAEHYQIEPVEDTVALPAEMNFPFDANGATLLEEQRLYFVADRTYKETCDECAGNKLIKCDDFECDGRHEWQCVDCHAKGHVTCHECAGQKRVDCDSCQGSGWKRCSSCGGDGKKVDKMDTFSAITSDKRSTRIVKKTCGTCSGKGKNRCTSCNNGKVSCGTCSGNGKVTCESCKGHKKITCEKCYGDKDRYGMIDCPQCKAQGEMGYLSYVKTTLQPHESEQLFAAGERLNDVTDDEVLAQVNNLGETDQTIVNINEHRSEQRDAYVEPYARNIMESFNLSLEGLPKLLEEQVYYQVVPCVQIKYTHMLTNQQHEVSIINFFDNPQLKFHQAAEEVKKDIKDTGKKMGRFFGKMLKTKKFKSKDDRKKEIRLMIYLAKADGVIEEEEKQFLAGNINSIEEFTSTEKSEFFDLMNAPSLPDLTKEDVTFSSSDKFNEVLSTLQNLASSDGNVEASEQKVIDTIRSLG